MLIISALLASAPVALSAPESGAVVVQPAAAEMAGVPPAGAAQAAAEAAPQQTEPLAAAPAEHSGTQAASPAPAARPRDHEKAGDSLEGFNRAMFGTWRVLDKAVYRPAAMAYKHVAPKPLRTGIRHVLSNLTEPLVFLNFLLQGKPRSASRTLARFVINSTVGVGGLIDVANDKTINLPHRNNGFGTTLALYGVGPGPYIFLPFLGPSNLRDLLGTSSEGLLIPLAVGTPFDTIEYQLATAVVGGLDQRAESDDALKALLSGAVDPYATLRSAWQQNRVAEIEAIRHGGEAPRVEQDQPELEDPLADPAAAQPAAPQPVPELSDPLEDPAAKPPAP
ncbi:VacJ family lipoprotein [Novosphingobium sp.]|uniref:MlaA family lipoprotein n=1 Tax=Novosphingobium sp. TaxID=1874826 RepID=UPI0025D597A3|nr:VacJ family lipoprotein [Novosphingobium sp.]